MASTFSTNLKIELMATGENSGTWGTVTNTNLGTALEQAIVGYGNPSYSSDANLTISLTDSNAAQAARALVLNVTSSVSLTATRELVVPTIQKQYIVQNNTTGSQSITVKTSAGTGITVPSGRKAHLYVDGTNVIFMDDYVDINGGTIDNVTIGGSTPAAGNFTTVDTTNLEVTNIKAKDGTAAASIADSTGVISITSNPVLSGGTANGVLYLNGSKVATSGSALTFDGTNVDLATVGAKVNFATTSSATRNYVGGAADGFSLEMVTQRGALQPLSYKQDYAVGHAWSIAGSGAMTLTSTGLGIGTSSPSAKLQIKGTVNFEATNSTNVWNLYTYTDNTLRWNYNGAGADELVLDSSGNLGLGVTPSAGGLSGYSLFEMSAGGGSLYAGTNQLLIGSNVSWNGSTASYKTSHPASLYNQASGAHSWSTAASGTAGNAITFTQAMTLDASGRLLLGTTTTTNNLRLDEKVAIVGVNVPYNGMALTGYTGAGGSAYRPVIDFNRSRGTTDGSMTVLANSDYLGSIIFRGSDGTSFQDSAMISSEVDGTPGANDMPGRLTFWTSPDGSTTVTERARITSGGDFLVGTTTAGAGIGFDVKLAVDAGSGETSIFKTSSSGAYPSRMWNSATTGDNAFSGFLTEGGGTLRGSITYNRAAGLVAYNTTSDYRAKDIIGPVANPGATIDALKVYEGKMKGATQSRPMLVAHEAQDHAPYAVTGEKDAVNEDGTPKYQQMDVSSLVPLLLAEIQSLRARVAQLESKGV